MSQPYRPPARRGASGAWNTAKSRLKPAPSDPLSTFGLPSKGETRLNDSKAQESFYNKIVERYMKFCGASGDALTAQFAALSVSNGRQSTFLCKKPTSKEGDVTAGDGNGGEVTALPTPTSAKPPSPELTLILSAMRKLREAIVATRRRDNFAQRAYIFIIHAALLVQAWESYVPALHYLLEEIHLETPLSVPELNEFVNYHILDLACRLGDYHAAFCVRYQYGTRDRRVDAVLKSLVRDDWVSFWRVRRRVDGHQRALLGFAEEGVRLHALKCLAKTYFTVEKAFVERSGDREWVELVKGGVGWELVEGDRVVIRRPKVG
ncbi:hypothetical protein E2P81_ATG04190 [Venturia nashicola]|nr:hypothetical protein E2P81_ATG04190 [Venturia nashicola]